MNVKPFSLLYLDRPTDREPWQPAAAGLSGLLTTATSVIARQTKERRGSEENAAFRDRAGGGNLCCNIHLETSVALSIVAFLVFISLLALSASVTVSEQEKACFGSRPGIVLPMF